MTIIIQRLLIPVTCVNDEDYSQCESESPDYVDDFTQNDELNQCQNICAVFNESNDKYDKLFARLEFKDGRMGVLCKIDTGADISVMPERIFKKLYPKKSLDPCSTRLSAYNGTTITTIGQVDLIVTHVNVQCPQKKCSIYKRNRNVHTHIAYNHLFCIQCVISGRSLISVVWYVHTGSLLPTLNLVSYYHAASLERGTNIDHWIFKKNYFFDNFKPP